MAVPKRRTTSSKRDMRRSHDRLKPLNVVDCPRCHSKKLAHRVCGSCGYYNNKEIIKMATEKK
ncbi:MAG: 50S ribosomal protein L32 [Actinomycetota bacterium]|jgi:large subunit ribosomal protein L32|nr:50S ribosomal protein L32 [Actinomycetota bacterium]